MKLIVLRGESKGRVIILEQGSNLVGRWDPDAGAFPEVDLETDDVEAKISRKHAIIQLNGDECIIEDIGSLNGTFVNRGPRLEPGQKVTLKAGDEVVVGKTFLRLEK